MPYGASYCGVFGCSNNSKNNKDLTFFQVPKNEERRRVWATLMNREDLITKPSRTLVCSSHFLTSMIKNKRLKWEALPSENMPVRNAGVVSGDSQTVPQNCQVETEPAGNTQMEVTTTESIAQPIQQPNQQEQQPPVFIDVTAGPERYPISVVVDDTNPAPNVEVAVQNIKVEPDCTIERATSPLDSFLSIQPRPFRCTECHKYTAETEEKMLRHVRKIHRGENPFQCYMCDYTTYNKSLFEEHVRIHQGIKPFKCSHCPYRSASKKNRKKHEKIHRPDNPHKCSQCGFIARHIRSLQCHMNTEHAQWSIDERSKSMTSCTYCKKKFDDIVAHEKNRKKCTECDTVLCNKSIMKRHMSSRHNQKHRRSTSQFVCAICSWKSDVRPRILLHLIHHPGQPICNEELDVGVLQLAGISGDGW